MALLLFKLVSLRERNLLRPFHALKTHFFPFRNHLEVAHAPVADPVNALLDEDHVPTVVLEASSVGREVVLFVSWKHESLFVHKHFLQAEKDKIEFNRASSYVLSCMDFLSRAQRCSRTRLYCLVSFHCRWLDLKYSSARLRSSSAAFTQFRRFFKFSCLCLRVMMIKYYER